LLSARTSRLLSVALTCLVAACSRADSASSTESTATRSAEPPAVDPVAQGYPRTLDLPGGGQLELNAPPARILPTNASALDFVLEFVGASAVVAVSPVSVEYSIAAKQHEWDATQFVGRYTGENVLVARPDLVVNHAWQDAAVTDFVRRAGIPVLTLPDVTSLDDIVAVFELMGLALDRPERARELASTARARASALAAAHSFGDTTLIAFSHYGSGGSCAGQGTTYDLMFQIAGLRNAAAEHGLKGFATANNERLIDMNPDWIVVGVSAKDPSISASEQYLRNEPVLGHMDAVRTGRFIRLPADLNATSSHFVIDAAEAVVAALREADAALREGTQQDE